MSMMKKREMPSEASIKLMYPLSDAMLEAKNKNDAEISAIIRGEDNRLLLIIGPCSADREDAVLEYASRLRRIQEKVADKILLLPRVYTNKPRTTGEGYKGMLHQPNPAALPDMLSGIIAIRRMHISVLEQTGFSSADEMLYPENYSFLSDCLSYVAVGARSVENQQHRLVASGLNVPAGMKNPTSGEPSVLMNSVKAAQSGHTFVFSGWEVESTGNPLAHAILRGYTNPYGRAVPNYHYENLLTLNELYVQGGLVNPAVIIDTNHSNSGKKWDEQPRIVMEVLHSMRHNGDIRRLVKGLMVESYLADGCQRPDGVVFGQSITDPCLGWEKTEQMIYNIAEVL